MADSQDPGESRARDFYISYAGADRQWAEWVGWHLSTAGYTFVLGVWHWLPGDNIVLAREDALQRANQVLALCSRAYFAKGFTEQEWTAVLAAHQNESRRLIPIWVEDLKEDQLPRLLQSTQPIKLFGLPEAEATRHLLEGLSGDLVPHGPVQFPGTKTLAEPQADDRSKPRLPSPDYPSVWHVPQRNNHFVGRDSLLVRIREELLHVSRGTVILQGLGGMGKTQLSNEYAHRFASDYDVAWAIDAEQPELITAQLADLATALGVATIGNDAQTAATAALSTLRDRKRWLLIFDNVEGPDDFIAFLPDGPGHVLVTTRAGMWQEIGQLIEVGEFSRAESTTLLTARAGGLAPADANRVADAVGDLPLALAQAAGVLQTAFPAGEFQRALDSQATQILSQGKPRFYPTSLAATTLVALDKLTATDPAAADLLCLCAYLAPESIPATWFSDTAYDAAMPGSLVDALPHGPWAASQAYGRIRDVGLGRVDQEGLRLHRLTQAIVRDQTAKRRDAYWHTVVSVLTAAAPPTSNDPLTWPRWSALVPHLLMVTAKTDSAPLRPLAIATTRYLLFSGQTMAALTLVTRLHRDWAQQLGPDDPDVLTAAQHHAHAIFDGGDYTRATEMQTETLGRRRRTLGDDHPDTLHSANDLAVGLASLGQHQAALTLDQDTYERRRRILGEDHPDTLTSANNLASALNRLGQSREALPVDQDIYDRRRRIQGEDHPDTLTSANNLANTLSRIGRPREALMLNRRTYERRRQVLGADHPDTLTSASNLAAMLYELGQRHEALALNQDTYERRRHIQGADHPDTLISKENLARNLEGVGQRKAAHRIRGQETERPREQKSKKRKKR